MTKKEQLSNSETPKIKYALADKYEEENKKIEDKEQKTYDRLKSKESDKLPQPTGWRMLLLPFKMKEKTKDYINFRFNLIIRDLKNFTNFISELKQKDIKFKIIRHEEKRNAFTQKIFKYFKKN